MYYQNVKYFQNNTHNARAFLHPILFLRTQVLED